MLLEKGFRRRFLLPENNLCLLTSLFGGASSNLAAATIVILSIYPLRNCNINHVFESQITTNLFLSSTQFIQYRVCTLSLMVHQGRTYDYAIVIRTVTVYTWTIINCAIRTISTNSIEPTIVSKVGSIPNNKYAQLTCIYLYNPLNYYLPLKIK